MGHTHEDVDQFFSRIAAQLRKKGAESIPGKSTLHNLHPSNKPVCKSCNALNSYTKLYACIAGKFKIVLKMMKSTYLVPMTELG